MTPPTHQSHALSRRQLLQAGGLGAFNLAFPGMVTASVDVNRPLGSGAAEKSCIFLWLCGGPSHLDTWDLKPDAADEIRGPYRPIATNVPGMQICELAPKLAQMAQNFSIIRSMMHVGNISNHFDAMHHCLAGQAGAPADAPYIGSVLSKVRPTRQNAVSYVWLLNPGRASVFISAYIATGGYLGAKHAPMFIGNASNHPAMPNFRGPEDLFGPADEERMEGRRQLLDKLNPSESLSGNRVGQDWQDLQRRAFELASGPNGRQVFELDREPANLRDRYGRHPLGQHLLLARRLVEAGVRCITVSGWTGPSPQGGNGSSGISSWDMHGGHMGMGNAFGGGTYGMGWCLPRLDEALSALLGDLQDRGLLERTLVVVIGEFGRSPRIVSGPGSPGRVHWPDCFSALLAGGGIRGGRVYGQSDKIGAYVKDAPVRPQDLGATIYHALDVPLDSRLGRDDGILRPITTGQPILALLQ